MRGVLPDGRKVNVRNYSKSGYATLEIQKGKNVLSFDISRVRGENIGILGKMDSDKRITLYAI